MKRIFRLVRDLSKIPWSIRSVVDHDEVAWFAQNVHRRRFVLSKLQRDLLFAGEHPLRFAFSLLALQISLLVLVAVLPSDWFVPAWFRWEVAEQLAHFATVWTIQATLAALVYPIVISFVAVYLQRRPAAEAFIHLYMLDSGGLAAGLSSLALVVVMGVQYLMLSTWGTAWLPGWAAIDTAWFVLNAALTTFFLFRTVEFLRPEVQAKVIQRYTINVALPREIQRLSLYQVLASGISKGWFPVPSYGDDKVLEGPRLLIRRFGLREGTAQGELHLRTQVRLIDVRLWLVRLVIGSWYRKAQTWPRPDQPKIFGVDKSWPLLTLLMSPGTVYESKLPLAHVADGPALTAWQKWLLRWSVVLRSTSRERYGIGVEAIIGELAADARSLAAKSDNEGFERAYSALINLHGLLLAACLDKTESGDQGSWARLPDPEKFFGRELHEVWSEAYRGVFQAAIEGMVRDTQPLRRLCHLLQQLDGDELRASPIEIREHLMQMPPLMMYQLSNWWVFRVEEQGIIEHSHKQMVVLRPPLNRVYDEVLSTFVAGWENGRPDKPRRNRDVHTLDWAALPGMARLNVKHIEETARMLLAAVLRGDQAAAEWLADVLNKWWGTLGFDQGPYQLYDKMAFITVDDLGLAWPAFRTKFGLETDDNESQERLKKTLQQGAFQAALRNYWTDVRLLSIELMLDWVRTVPPATASSSLAFEIAAGLLTGKQWKSGGQVVDSLSNLSPPEYLVAKVRQFAVSGVRRGDYVGRLDRFVERVKDMRRPNMVSSRVYSFGGADDVESLQESQLELLAVVASVAWGLPRSLQRQVDVWFDPRFDQYSSIDILRSRLRSWLERLGTQPGLSAEHIDLMKKRVRSGVPVPEAIEYVRAGLLTTQQALEGQREKVLAVQPIDPNRLQEIRCYASTSAFNNKKGCFPVHLFPIGSTGENLEDFTLTFTQMSRGEFTQMPMEPRAGNEAEYFADAMAQQVASVVLSDVLHQLEIKEVAVHDAEAYWKALQAGANAIVAKGETPILLLGNATTPDWVWDWQHSDFGATHKRPDDLQVRRLEGRGDGYLCNFNDIEVYVAPLPIGASLLLSKDSLQALTFTDYGDECFVQAEVDDLKGAKNLVDLKLTFSRKVEVGERSGIRLIYAQANE
ncbi:hypothetical protein [Vogesella indigofera]|uniref:hypothetical protein n=1 Tax=Vogesella indigofera TaxID=45465 RepID=UPI00234DB878|nr:hypothetical protein [Vogesella indigofera]MDC7704694.1 hypothetical protein [Vogesella indigofera]